MRAIIDAGGDHAHAALRREAQREGHPLLTDLALAAPDAPRIGGALRGGGPGGNVVDAVVIAASPAG